MHSNPININKVTANTNTKRFVKTDEYMNINFTSIMGPKTRNASFDVVVNVPSVAAMNASEVLHSDNTNASIISKGTATQSFPVFEPGTSEG